MVVVVLPVAMPPGPVFLLFVWRKLAKIAMRVTVVFPCPLVVIDDLVVIPDVVIAVVRVIDPIVMMRASRAQNGRGQRGSQTERSDQTRVATHFRMNLLRHRPSVIDAQTQSPVGVVRGKRKAGGLRGGCRTLRT